jgi:hypothetical protein
MLKQDKQEYKAKARVETTINIDKEVYARISEAAKKYDISRSRLIAMLMKIMADNEEPDEEKYMKNTVTYQDAQEKENWKKLHIVVYKTDYEFFDDARKLWKKSFSHLVAYVGNNYLVYLDEFSEEDFTDNYRNIAYFTIYFIQYGVPCLLVCWRIPQEPITIPPD